MGCWRPKFSNFLTVFTIGLSLTRFWRAFGISGGEGFEHPNTLPPRYATSHTCDHLVAKQMQMFVPVLKLSSSNFKITCIYLFICGLSERRCWSSRSSGKEVVITEPEVLCRHTPDTREREREREQASHFSAEMQIGIARTSEAFPPGPTRRCTNDPGSISHISVSLMTVSCRTFQ